MAARLQHSETTNIDLTLWNTPGLDSTMMQLHCQGVVWVGSGWVPELKKSATKKVPGPPKVCFMKVFRYIKPTKRHSVVGGAGK